MIYLSSKVASNHLTKLLALPHACGEEERIWLPILKSLLDLNFSSLTSAIQLELTSIKISKNVSHSWTNKLVKKNNANGLLVKMLLQIPMISAHQLWLLKMLQYSDLASNQKIQLLALLIQLSNGTQLHHQLLHQLLLMELAIQLLLPEPDILLIAQL